MEIRSRRLTAEEYIEFLRHTDLGSQYPQERFYPRIEKLVRNASISLVAEDEDGIAGVLFGLTDFAYWLYVTDLGVVHGKERQGIGRALMERALEEAGGEKDINVYLVANDKAIPFYEKLGMKKSCDVMEYCKADWTSFVVQ